MIKLLLDQDIYHKTYNLFKETLNIDVIRAQDIGCERSSDIDLLEEAAKRSRFLVTRDKDFGALVFLSKIRTHGIIFLRMNPGNIEQVHNTLIEYINHLNPEDIMEKFVTIEPDKYRIRGTLST